MPPQSLIPLSSSVEDVFNEITKAGIDKADAATIVGHWIIETAGRTPRVFDYKTDFPGADPDATSQFTRSFVHQDWVDGEDVVQAEETTGEEGFNLRFHRIESDLDAAGRDLGTAFLALANQRAALRQLLDEIKTELNVINASLAQLTRPPFPVGPPVGPVLGGVSTGTFVGATSFFGKAVNVFRTDQGTVMLPAISGVQMDPTDNPRVQRVTDFGKFLTDQRVTDFFTTTGTVNRDKFIAKFGDEQLDSGALVRDVIDILPPEANFTSSQTMLDGLASREGAAIRTSPIEGQSIAASLGIDPTTAVADAPVDRIESIPTDSRNALVAAGVTSVGALAKANPALIATELHNRGLDATGRDAAGWVAIAKTLVNVQ